MSEDIRLRETTADDLPILFEQQRDPEANAMVAFGARDPNDRDAFMTHWTRVLGNPSNIKQTILCDGQVAGSMLCFEMFGQPVVGYWLGREYWGRGLATRALAAFLSQVVERPLYARVAKHNRASVRVLEKCGFQITGEDSGFSEALGAEVEEFVLTLGAHESQ